MIVNFRGYFDLLDTSFIVFVDNDFMFLYRFVRRRRRRP